MRYKVVFKNKAIKSLKKIDKSQQIRILSWIEKNLESTDNPRKNGSKLKGELGEYWRYRVGKYRMIAEIDDFDIKIIIVNIGHRKNIYNN